MFGSRMFGTTLFGHRGLEFALAALCRRASVSAEDRLFEVEAEDRFEKVERETRTSKPKCGA